MRDLLKKFARYLEKIWIAYFVIGVIFLILSCFNLLKKRESIADIGLMFIAMGIVNIFYSLTGIRKKFLRWGEFLFWGVIETFSGWLIIGKKITDIELQYADQMSKAVGKIASSEIEISGYFVIFYTGFYLIFKGVMRVFTKVYRIEQTKYQYRGLRFILNIGAFKDLIFGILILLAMYLYFEKLGELFNYYMLITTILLILFGLGVKRAIRKYSEELELESEKEKKITN